MYLPAAAAACITVWPGVKGMSSPSSRKESFMAADRFAETGSADGGGALRMGAILGQPSWLSPRWAPASSRPVIRRACDSAASRSKAGS